MLSNSIAARALDYAFNMPLGRVTCVCVNILCVS